MTDRWYYAHDANKIGPFSDRQLRDLADTGNIVPTDTIWKEGVVKGVLASKVKYLFPAAPASAPSVSAGVSSSEDLNPAAPPGPSPPEPTTAEAAPSNPAPDVIVENLKLREEEPTPPPTPPIAPPKPVVKKGRVVAVKGAVIVSQDGTLFKFRKKCTTCGQEDTSWNTMKITTGCMRAIYYCPKCRKKRDVEMQGFTH